MITFEQLVWLLTTLRIANTFGTDESNVEYRGLTGLLLTGGALISASDCEKLTATMSEFDKSILPRGETASVTRQWINVKFGQKEFDEIFEYRFNARFRKFVESNKLPLAAFIVNMESFIKHVSKIKGDVFVKIGLTDNELHIRETEFYRFWTTKMFNRYIPHVPSIIFSTECERVVGNVKIGNEKLGDTMPASLAHDYLILATEMMTNSKSLEYYFTKLLEADQTFGFDDPTIVQNFIESVFFQITYTLMVFKEFDFVHNDLHMGNIMIAKINTPLDYVYVIKDKNGITRLVRLKSSYLVRIFDFDLSYFMTALNDLPDGVTNGRPYSMSYKTKPSFTYVDDVQLKKMTLLERRKYLTGKEEYEAIEEYDYRANSDFYYIVQVINQKLYSQRSTYGQTPNYKLLMRYINDILHVVDDASEWSTYRAPDVTTIPNNIMIPHIGAGGFVTAKTWLNDIITRVEARGQNDDLPINIVDSHLDIKKNTYVFREPLVDSSDAIGILKTSSNLTDLTPLRQIVTCGALISPEFDIDNYSEYLRKSVVNPGGMNLTTMIALGGCNKQLYNCAKTDYLNLIIQ